MTAEGDGPGLVERLRRDFAVKKGDVVWRRRERGRYGDGPAGDNAHSGFNTRYAGKPAGKLKRGKRIIVFEGRTWRLPDLVETLKTGVLPPSLDPESPDGPTGPAGPSGYAVGGGPLGLTLAMACAGGLPAGEVTVLDAKADPFRLDTRQGHAKARWFMEQVERLIGDRERFHLRGLHYRLVASGDVIRPDGGQYENTQADADWLNDMSKAARWLGYLPFERVVDQKNPDPIIFRQPREDRYGGRPFGTVSASFVYRIPDIFTPADPEVIDLPPSPLLCGFRDKAESPFAFAFFGEKSSLEPVLAPLARRYEADLYLAGGELSDTLIYRMARDASADGRPLVVFTFSDFDPAGIQMPVSIARKLQALKALSFSNLAGQVCAVSLDLEQAVQFRLPVTPVKPGDKRRDRWQQAYGPALYAAGLIASPDQSAQVEVDALAALRPDDLTAIAEAAIDRYRDAGFASRAARAASRWREAAALVVAEQVNNERIAAIKREALEAVADANAELQGLREAGERVREHLRGTRERLSEINRRIEHAIGAIELPAPPAQPEPEIDEAAHDPLIDLDWGFVDATRALKARKAYADGEAEDETA